MTAQIPDMLINEHPSIDINGLSLFGVIRGDTSSNHGWGEPYQFENQPHPPEGQRRSTALHRGYISSFRLTAAGTLLLVEFRYPESGIRNGMKGQSESINEQLTGDFWLVLQPTFFGPRTYVPFENGRIVEDKSLWHRERKERSIIDELRNPRTYVTQDVELMGGVPVFSGTRVPVSKLFGFLEENKTLEEFLARFPDVSREFAVGVLQQALTALIHESRRSRR